MGAAASFTAIGRTDDRDWLVEADEPLASLQVRCGGALPGIIAAPALLELVRKARLYGLKLAKPIRAQDEREAITAWVEVTPDEAGAGCVIGASNWQATALGDEQGPEADARRLAIARHLAELTARVGPRQQVIVAESRAVELDPLAQRMRAAAGAPWTEFVAVQGGSSQGAAHWRLLDRAMVRIDGSERAWRAHLAPLGAREPGSEGFELYLVADEPPPAPPSAPNAGQGTFSTAIGREIAPVLRQPIARIIANAETIRTQLAGPLADEYSNYAADIASAGQHLLALIDDLADLEVVEDDDFTTAPDQIDLADVARRAAGILGVRAQERGIRIDAPKEREAVFAIGEFRRVLQILLNLVGNAIRYAPEGSTVWLRAEVAGGRARLTVSDEGQGLSEIDQARVFNKFERLGRSGDGGSGLGLYISRRLARAMNGELSVANTPGEGARFILELPCVERRSAESR